MFNRRALGLKGEDKAIVFLEAHGYRVIDRNYKGRRGEIDIIAYDGSDLVFIEVKLRRSDAYGSPHEAVDKIKQYKIVKLALQYVKVKNLFNENIRFDVLIIGPEDNKVELLKSAFEAGTGYMY